jgi:hypothetical protein
MVHLVKVYKSYSLSKDALREEKIPWLIKCPGKGNLSDVWHFNTPLHEWQLIAKHVDNNEKKNAHHYKKHVALRLCEKFIDLLTFSKDALREKEIP